MRNSLLIAWTVIVISTVFCGGCASPKADKGTQTEEDKPALRAMGEGVKADETPSNESIGFEIRRRLNDNPSETAGIIVEVDDGKVTLRGAAPNAMASWRAEAAAHAVKGVKQVVNQILVTAAGTGTPLTK